MWDFNQGSWIRRKEIISPYTFYMLEDSSCSSKRGRSEGVAELTSNFREKGIKSLPSIKVIGYTRKGAKTAR